MSRLRARPTGPRTDVIRERGEPDRRSDEAARQICIRSEGRRAAVTDSIGDLEDGDCAGAEAMESD